MPTKTRSQQRTATIRIKYHFTSAGRRPGLRPDVAGAVMRAVVRRLERKGPIVVDDIEIVE